MTRLRLQLVLILLLVALLPALPAALTVRALFDESLDPLIGTRVEAGARAGMASTRELLAIEIAELRRSIRGGTADTLRVPSLDDRDRGTIEALLAARPHAPGADLLVEPQRVELSTGDVLVAASGERARHTWFARTVPESLSARAERLTDNLRLVKGLEHERGAVRRSLLATFLVVYGVILLVVIVLGLWLASRVTRPMAALGAGIGRVAAGALDTRVPETSGGAMGRLVEQFNGMVDRLATQQGELVRLEKLAAWRQMARRLAHEIKNPLTPIQLAAQEMRDAYEGADDDYRSLLHEGTGIIEEEVGSLRTLVSSFSQFSRMPDPAPTETTIGEIARDLELLYGAQVNVEVVDGRLRADRDQIHRALVNLVNNALDAQSSAGVDAPVEVTCRAREDSVELVVSDRGPGVPEELRARIFEPDVTTKSDGMGLGLAIVAHTVVAHGGDITLETAGDTGARFTIVLPTEGPAADAALAGSSDT